MGLAVPWRCRFSSIGIASSIINGYYQLLVASTTVPTLSVTNVAIIDVSTDVAIGAAIACRDAATDVAVVVISSLLARF